MNFYGLWISNKDKKKIDECLETGIWHRGKCPDKKAERKKMSLIKEGDDVFLYHGVEDVKLRNSPFAEYLSQDQYDFNKNIVKARSVATGKIVSFNTEDLSINVQWHRPYKTNEWYVYFRQDGIWKFDETQDKALKDALYELVFHGKAMNEKWWTEHLDWSKKKLIKNNKKSSWKMREELFKKWAYKTVKRATSIDSYITSSMNKAIPMKLKELKEKNKDFESVFQIENIHELKGLYKRLSNGDLESFNQKTYNRQPSAAVKKYMEWIEAAANDRELQDQSYSSRSLNQILYGPPGTGKTYYTNRLKEQFIYREESMSDIEWLFEIIKELTWFEVAVMALYDLGGRAKVPQITEHNFIRIKAIIQNKEKGIPQQIWAALQIHTVLESETVKYKNRIEPFVFNKIENSVWIFIDGYEEIIPDIIDVYNKIKNEKPQSKELHNYEFITFHQSYGYEEFVEGIRAIPPGEKGNEDGAEMIYKVTDGVFKRIAKDAKSDPEHNYAIFIDEINRGNISKIFGELITLIEDSKRLGNDEAMEATLPYSGEKFGVPKNLYIIGTMNTADRSIALMDTALRRRFEFEEMMPRPELLDSVDGIDLEQLLGTINKRIEYLYDRDHTIGHAYLIGVEDKTNLDNVMRNKVIPLLQEYFYDDWEKIRLVLNDGFIERTTQDASKLFDSMDDEYIEEDKYTYSIAREFSIDSYRKIYGSRSETNHND